MAKGKKPKSESGKHQELVPVIYARNQTEAEFYKGLLTSNDIPAVIEDEAGGEAVSMPTSIVGQGVPVLVPDEMLDEASEIIAEHEDTEEEEELDEYEEMDDEADEDLDELDDDLDEDFEDEEAEEDEDLDELDDDLDEDIEGLDEPVDDEEPEEDEP